MKFRYILYSIFICSIFYSAVLSITGCAQIGYPTGGPKDTIPPVLLKAAPPERTTNFTGKEITLTFNEYIDVQDIQNNLLVAPFPKANPNITHKLKTVTVKLKDTLLANTTYAIDFGNSLKDLNEGNPFRNYTYVFSTGKTIDSMTLSGTVVMAETGKTDSTITAMLYKDAPDSAVQTRKPNYIARLNRQGNFTFKNLSAGAYKLYALKDGDGGKTYNSAIETFAFAPKEIFITDSVKKADTLFAYAEEKDVKKTAASATKTTADKKLKASVAVNPNAPQSLLSPLEITFNRPVKTFDEQKIQLTDSSYKQINGVTASFDSTRKILALSAPWAEGFDYALIIGKESVTDSTDAKLSKSDTIHFKSKEKRNYGNLVLRFKNYKASLHLMLQIFQGETLFKSIPVTSESWNDKMFEPGDYDVRVLYDDNNNGKWDPGNYKEKRQPERAITLSRKLSVRADWDNEKDIEL